MNLTAIYSKTGKGARALAAKNKTLSAHALRVLSYVDGKTNAEHIWAQLGKLSEEKFTEAITDLVAEGCVKEIGENYLAESLSALDIHTPIVVAEISAEEFLRMETEAVGNDAETQAREKSEAEARAKAYEEQQRRLQEEGLHQQEAERRLLNVADILAKSSDSLDIEHLATQEPARLREKRRAEARAQAKARKLEASEQARREAEQKAEAELAIKEQQLRKEAEERSRREQQAKEAAEAEQARLAALREEARLQAERETHAQREAEERARIDAQLTAEAKAREEEAKARAEVEARARREAEERARIEAQALAEEAKRKAAQQAREAAEAKARAEAEQRARREAEKQAREAEKRARLEAENRAKAERKAQQAAETQAAREAKLKRQAELKTRQQAEAQARSAAKARARQEAEQRAALEAENRARERAEYDLRKQQERERKAEIKRQAKMAADAAALARAQEKALYRSTHPAPDFLGGISRRSKHVKKTLIGTACAVLLLLIATPFFNLGFLADGMEKTASARLGEPVNIESLHVSFWPRPHFTLEEVSAGSTGDIKASKVRLVPEVSTLTDEAQVLDVVEISGLMLNEDNLPRLAGWLDRMRQDRRLKIKKLALDNAAVSWQGLSLPIHTATINFSEAGLLQQAALSSQNRDVLIELSPANRGYALDIAAQTWQSPVGAPIVFDELTAQGFVNEDGMKLEAITGRLYNGKLEGQLALQWQNGWAAQGTFNLVQLDLAPATSAFTDKIALQGALSANGVIAAQTAELQNLFAVPDLNARFEASEGAILGIDLLRAIQSRDSGKAISGTTEFNSVTGNLVLNNQHYQYRNLALSASRLQAKGEVDIFANQELSGKVEVKLQVKSRPVQSRVYLSGKLNQPTVQ